MAKGRPTKFKPEHCQMIVDFFSGEPYELKEIITEGTGKNPWKKVEYKLFPNKLPTITDFSAKIQVDDDQIVEWAKKSVDKELDRKISGKYWGELNGELVSFHAAYARAKQLYKNFLIHNGLVGTHNAPYAKFVAINTTDMKDESVVRTPDLPTNESAKKDIEKMSTEAVEKALAEKIFSQKTQNKNKKV